MKVHIMMRGGRTTSLFGVNWHPEYTKTLEPGWPTHFPAGCWVSKTNVKAYNDSYNRNMKKMFPRHVDRLLSEFIDSIECSEIPLEIIDCSEDRFEPWKDSGNRLKQIPYGMYHEFWNSRA